MITQTRRQRLTVPVLAVLGIAAGGWALSQMRPGHTLHAPDFSLLAQQSMVVKIHLAAALAAFALGVVMFLSRKGAPFHRVAGWTWVLLIATVAGSSLFITGLNGDHWSLIHLLSGWTLIILPFAVWAARKHDVKAHRRRMTGVFLGGMVIAGAFTFFPGRLMWAIFFR